MVITHKIGFQMFEGMSVVPTATNLFFFTEEELKDYKRKLRRRELYRMKKENK